MARVTGAALEVGGGSARTPGLPWAVGIGIVLIFLGAFEAISGERIPVSALAAGLAVFAVLCLAHLEVAFAVILAVTPFSVETPIGRTGSAMQLPTEPMLLLALAAWVLRFMIRGSTSFHQPATSGLMLLALGACLVS